MARIHPDGSVLVESGTQDTGTGTYTIITQIAADGMQVAMAQVTFRRGDTTEPEAPVSTGSQTATSVGSAVKSARNLREKLCRLAIADSKSQLYGGAARDVELRGGRPSLRNRAKSEELARLLGRSGAPLLEAESDSQPGRGRILNARTARGQFIGGMVRSMGMRGWTRGSAGSSTTIWRNITSPRTPMWTRT